MLPPRNLVLVLVLVASICPPVLAQDKPEVDKLNQQAVAKILMGDADGALALLDRALEVDGTAGSAMYNKACVLAKGKRDVAGALLWLERSVDGGWVDATHTKADRDLALVQREERFQAILDKMADASRLRGAVEFRGAPTGSKLGSVLFIMPLFAAVRLPDGATLSQALGLPGSRFTIEVQAFLGEDAEPFDRRRETLALGDKGEFTLDLAKTQEAARKRGGGGGRKLEVIIAGQVGSGAQKGLRYPLTPGSWRELASGGAKVQDDPGASASGPPTAAGGGGGSTKLDAAAVSGVWKDAEGMEYRLALDEGALVGHGAGPEVGCRLKLTALAGGLFEGTASFSRVGDETGFERRKIALELAGETLKGNVQGRAGDLVLTRAAPLSKEDAAVLRKAMALHFKVDAELEKGNPLGASDKLTIGQYGFRGGPEQKAIEARLKALSGKRKAIEGAQAEASEHWKIGKELFWKGKFAEAKPRFVKVEAAQKDDTTPGLIKLCDMALEGEKLDDVAALQKLVEKAFALGDRKDLSEPAYFVMSALYHRCATLEPAEAAHAFDCAAALYSADQWERAHAALRQIAEKDPAAKGKTGKLAIELRDGLADAIQRRPAYDELWDIREDYGRKYGYSDPRYEKADELFKREKSAIDQATDGFDGWFVREYRGGEDGSRMGK